MFVPGTGSSYECRFAFPANTFTITATNNGSGMFTCALPPEDQLRPIVQASRGEGRGSEVLAGGEGE